MLLVQNPWGFHDATNSCHSRGMDFPQALIASVQDSVPKIYTVCLEIISFSLDA